MGRAIPGHVVDVVDEGTGTPLPDGEVGCIGVRAPHPVMMLRYWNKPEATAAKYAGGYLLTGDLATRDSEGFFTFFGRADDVIKSAGYRIGPAEIEECMMKHPDVQNVAVVGVPDDMRGERVKAYVVLRPDSIAKSVENNAQFLLLWAIRNALRISH
jgi:acetyl-CoA synthetase